MKRILTISLLIFACSPCLSANTSPAAKEAFQRLESLAGEWEGKDDGGTVVKTSFKMVAGNTVILETLAHAGMDEMLTLYSVDRDSIALQHYCPTNNQPRMRAMPSAGEIKELVFAYQGAGNLPNPAIGHQHKLVIEFQDATHITERWTWRDHGKDTEMVFHFTRKTSGH